MNHGVLRNPSLLVAASALRAALFPIPVITIFWKDQISRTVFGVVFYLGFMTVQGLYGPLLASVLQADAPHEDRASVLSLNTLLFRLASVIVLPPVGALADRFGLEPVLVGLGFGSAAVAMAAWWVFARAHGTTK